MGIILFSLIALIASIQDIRTREVSNIVHILIILISIPFLTFNKVIGSIIGFMILFIPNLFRENGIGGADIKFMFASGLILGIENTLIATIVSMIVAIIYVFIRKSILKNNIASIPLIPFLSIGCLVSYLI